MCRKVKRDQFIGEDATRINEVKYNDKHHEYSTSSADVTFLCMREVKGGIEKNSYE